jgi:hypothetical protein
MPTLLRNLLLILLIAGFFSVNKTSRVAAAQNAQQNADSRRAQLKQLLVDEWEYELRESPELATSIGDYRYNDRWSDSSWRTCSSKNVTCSSGSRNSKLWTDPVSPSRKS